MAIYVDDVTVEIGGQTVGELLEAAKQRLEPSGRVIVEVKIDGAILVGDDLVHRQSEDTQGRDLHLYTAEPRQMCLDALAQVSEQLNLVKQMQADAAEKLQEDNPAAALEILTQIIQNWLHVQEAVLHTAQLMEVDLDLLTIDDKGMIDTVDALRQQLEDIKNMLTSGDTVGLADALAYEWPQTVDHWQQLIELLLKRIAGADV